MKRVLLLIDLSYHVYRASAAHPLLTSSDNAYTGGLYGFFVSWAKAIKETRATDLVICTDVKPYLRSLAYPEYKQLRKKSRDEDLVERYKASIPIVTEALQAIGITPWGRPGFESDDLMGYAVVTHRHRYDRIYGATNDSDAWQLFEAENFATFNTDVADAWDAARLLREHDLTPAQFMLATALQGTHNDIEGIKGVGAVTARKAVKQPALLRDYMSKHRDLIERNLSLIKLPHPQLPKLRMPVTESASSRDLYRALGRWDVKVTAAMVEALGQIQPRKSI